MADDQKPLKGHDDQPGPKQVGRSAEVMTAVEDEPEPKPAGTRDGSDLKRKLAED